MRCSLLPVQEWQLSIPGTPGVTDATISETLVPSYNDRAAVREAFAAFGDEIAALITEAAPGNMGVVPPGTEDGIGFNAFWPHRA